MSDRQYFEDYPGLKAHMSRMATSGIGSMIEWTAFIVTLNTALTEARAQGAAEERESLMSLALGSEADGYARYDGHVAEWLRTLTEGTTP